MPDAIGKIHADTQRVQRTCICHSSKNWRYFVSEWERPALRRRWKKSKWLFRKEQQSDADTESDWRGECLFGKWQVRRRIMNHDYVFLCGVMWAQYASEDAGRELVRARPARSRRGTSSQRYSRKKVASSWNVVRSLKAAAQVHLGRRNIDWRGGKERNEKAIDCRRRSFSTSERKPDLLEPA